MEARDVWASDSRKSLGRIMVRAAPNGECKVAVLVTRDVEPWVRG